MPGRVTRREVLTAAVAAVVGGALSHPAGAATSAAASRARRPNIIFVLADDLGYGDLGCYGQKRIRTPHLDRMAAEGVRFTQAYAGQTVCAPSRCCLMTGLHTGHARIRGNRPVPLQPEDVTVAEVLKAAGYATGVFGKWGLGEPNTTGVPNRQGFDEWFGYLNQTRAHNYYPAYLWRNETKVPVEGNQAGKKGEYSHDLFSAEALDFVRRHRSEPFFLYLAYTIPHANSELGEATGNGMEVPDDAPYSDRPWPQPQKNHAAMITRMDRDVGKLLALLGELGIDENTVVFFSSDNGPQRAGGADPGFFGSNGPLRGIKRDLYEGGIRVPAIVRWPGQIKPGRVSDQVWAFWDFLPTAAELAGAKLPSNIDGVSILPALADSERVRHEYLYWERYGYGDTFEQAVRMGDFKAVRLGLTSPIELYDLKTDVGEQNDVASDRPKVVAKIASILETAHTDSAEWPIRQGAWRRIYTVALALGILAVTTWWWRRRTGRVANAPEA